jgi:peptidoglycan/LPS O-acetylase OafA/YrhL
MFNGPLFSTGTLWVVIFSTVLSYHIGVESSVTRPVRRFLDLPFVNWLGKVSYSTYLCHHIGLSLARFAWGGMFLRMGPWGRILGLVGFGFPLILALSAALYYVIERPGIRLGQDVSSWLMRSTAARDDISPGPMSVSEAKV